MFRKIIIIFIIGVVMAGIIVAIIRLFSGPEDFWLCQDSVWVKHGQPQEPMPSIVCGQKAEITASTTPEKQSIALPMVIEGPNGELKTANGHLEVTRPKKGQEVELPFKIKGQSVTFEGNVPFKVKEKSGKVLLSSCLMGGAYEMKSFTKTVGYFFTKPETKDIILEVYDDNPRGEGQTQFISLPLTLTKQGWITVKLFFRKPASDKLKPVACNETTEAVELAAPRSSTPAKRALELLLEGMPCGLNLAKEDYQGLITHIHPKAILQSLSVDEAGLAKADFSEELKENAQDPCIVSAIKAQITETLKQFPSIKEVIITANGQEF